MIWGAAGILSGAVSVGHMLTRDQAAYTFAFQIADAMIRAGAGSASVTKSLLSIFRKAGTPNVTVSVTLDQVTISHQAGPEDAPSTRMMQSEPGSLNIDLRTETGEVLEAFVLDRLTLVEAVHAMEVVRAKARTVGHRLTLAGYAMFGIGFSLVLGGGLVTTISSAVIAAAVYGVLTTLQRVKAPGIFGLAAGGFTAVLGATASGFLFSSSQPAVCIVAALAAWLAGVTAYDAVYDVVTGWYVSATGRILDAVVKTAGLVAGVTLGIHMMRPVFGDQMNYLEALAVDNARWGLPVLGAWLVSAGFALASGGRGWRMVALGALGGMVELTVLGLGAVGIGSPMATLLTSVAAGAVCVALTRSLNLTSNASMMVVLLPLFPGMMVYQGVLGTFYRAEGAGEFLLDAATTAFCLSAGGILGQYLASEVLWATRRRQFTRKYPGRSFRKEMAEEENFSDIMVPLFSKPFMQ